MLRFQKTLPVSSGSKQAENPQMSRNPFATFCRQNCTIVANWPPKVVLLLLR